MPLTKVPSLARRPISSRNPKSIVIDGQNKDNTAPISGKRKANGSPLRNEKAKRPALGNLTNAVLTINNDETAKKGISQKQQHNDTQMPKNKFGQIAQQSIKPRATKVLTRAASRATQSSAGTKRANIETIKHKLDEVSITAAKPKKKTEISNGKCTSQSTTNDGVVRLARQTSTEIDQTECEESIYMSAHEYFSSSLEHSKSISSSDDSLFTISGQNTLLGDVTLSQENVIESGPLKVPAGVTEFDRENWDDPNQVSHYAMDIFNYLKNRESQFIIEPYMSRQPHLTPWMRTLLVDWMVEVQETFELNHETLYLAVKLVDMYLSKVVVEKDKLQLVGAASLFLACKYDERTPPLIEDFLFICDGAYVHNEFTKMETSVFRTIGFDLGIPLSYRFLRRFARCAKVAMPELTLARFILEFSLMNYETIALSDSKLAAACLYMALKMTNQVAFNDTIEFYSGYKLSDFISIVPILNASLHQRPREAIKTVRNKYAHKIFHEVSKIPLMTTEKLLADAVAPFS